MLRADGRVGDGEREQLHRFARELGHAEVSNLLARASRTVTTESELRQVVLRVERQAAREAIYGALFDLAGADGLAPAEQAILEWLEEAWGLRVDPGDPRP